MNANLKYVKRDQIEWAGSEEEKCRREMGGNEEKRKMLGEMATS